MRRDRPTTRAALYTVNAINTWMTGAKTCATVIAGNPVASQNHAQTAKNAVHCA